VKRIPPKIQQKARRIKLLLLDVDGVLTDGGIVMDGRGEEIKRFHVRDGHGIRLLLRAGIQVGLITGRSSKAVTTRARDLGIRIVFQKAHDKLKTYEIIKRKTGLKDVEIAYAGDDLVDLPVLKSAGLAITVSDCWEGIQDLVDFVTRNSGGNGAVREIAEILLRAQGKWDKIMKTYYRN
jgi:3-deoxy-D-manno-octulosonate 8-phosphate phosphatase (KDO 8-P phosphatase)